MNPALPSWMSASLRVPRDAHRSPVHTRVCRPKDASELTTTYDRRVDVVARANRQLDIARAVEQHVHRFCADLSPSRAGVLAAVQPVVAGVGEEAADI